jgi:hypothetical protein
MAIVSNRPVSLCKSQLLAFVRCCHILMSVHAARERRQTKRQRSQDNERQAAHYSATGTCRMDGGAENEAAVCVGCSEGKGEESFPFKGVSAWR